MAARSVVSPTLCVSSVRASHMTELASLDEKSREGARLQALAACCAAPCL